MPQNIYLVAIGIIVGILARLFRSGRRNHHSSVSGLGTWLPTAYGQRVFSCRPADSGRIFGIIEYYKAGKIDMDNIKAGLIIAAEMVGGVYAGSRGALSLSSPVLRKAFAIFLFLIAPKVCFGNSGEK